MCHWKINEDTVLTISSSRVFFYLVSDDNIFTAKQIVLNKCAGFFDSKILFWRELLTKGNTQRGLVLPPFFLAMFNTFRVISSIQNLSKNNTTLNLRYCLTKEWLLAQKKTCVIITPQNIWSLTIFLASR